MSFPNLPIYVDGNVKLTKSNTILRHHGCQHGIYGFNENDAAKIDMLLDTIIEIKNGLTARLQTLVSGQYILTIFFLMLV